MDGADNYDRFPLGDFNNDDDIEDIDAALGVNILDPFKIDTKKYQQNGINEGSLSPIGNNSFYHVDSELNNESDQKQTTSKFDKEKTLKSSLTEDSQQELEQDKKRDEVKEFEQNNHNININLEVEPKPHNSSALAKESHNRAHSQKSNEPNSDKEAEEEEYNK